MDNYMNDTAQYNNNMMINQQPALNMFNQPSSFTPNTAGDTNQFNSSNSFNQSSGQNILNNNSALLNGTSLDDEQPMPNFNQNPNFIPNNNFSSSNFNSNVLNQEPTLIKNVAKEIINGLRENNMSLYDNSSINSYRGSKSNVECDDDENKDNENNEDNYSRISRGSKKSSKKSSKNKVKEVVETIEDFVVNNENSPKSYSEYAGWFFDECFNYKDFLVLFILYFVLSQEMIKDFFSKYFSSLNPDTEGKVGVQGVIIYGLILTVLFTIIKKLF
jgi:hypothetical protein